MQKIVNIADLHGLVNGNIVVGNAQKLNGLKPEEFVSDENLLVNPYFKDPVNLSGKTSWDTPVQYTVDKWYKKYGSTTAELTENGIKITMAGSSNEVNWLEQVIESVLMENCYTLSIKIRKSRADMHLRITAYDNLTSSTILTNISTENNTDWQVLNSSFENNKPGVVSIITDDGCTTGDWIEIEWIKLEVGLVSTPFIPPNPEVEKLKCSAVVENAVKATHDGNGNVISDTYTTKKEFNLVNGTEILTTSILEKALTLGAGAYNFVLGSSSYTGEDLPNTQYAYGTVSVYNRANNGSVVVLWGGRYNLPIAINRHNGTNWFGWETNATAADLDNLEYQINDELETIKTTSAGTLSTYGWYRVAKLLGSNLAHGLGNLASGVDLSIRRHFNNSTNEIHNIRLLNSYGNQKIVSMGDLSNIQKITQIRYTYETSGVAYLEVYYNSDLEDLVEIIVSNSNRWRAITPTLTEETVDGVTVTTTYDIPANASPVTDLDITVPKFWNDAQPLVHLGKVIDLDTLDGKLSDSCVYTCRYNLDNSMILGYYHNYNNGYGAQIKLYYYNKALSGRQLLNGTWTEWGDSATTADLDKMFKGGWANVNPVSDLNDFVTGLALFNGATNAPSTDWWFIISAGTNGTVTQVAFDLFNTYPPKTRKNAAGVWYDWNDLNVGLANYLPLSGGELAKEAASPLYLHRTNGTNVWTGYKIQEAIAGYLGFSGVDNPVYTSSDGSKINTLLHTGNKPSGTYNGNGSAEERTISTSGIGRVVAIYSGARLAFITGGGAILADANGVRWERNCTVNSAGVITIASSDGAINQSGQMYYWELL